MLSGIYAPSAQAYSAAESFMSVPTSPSPASRILSKSSSTVSAYSGDQDADDWTISDYGDISYSEINFVPSAPSDLESPRSRQKKKDDGYRRNAKRQPPPGRKKVHFYQYLTFAL